MSFINKITTLTLFFFLFLLNGFAQKTFTLSGYVKDAATGETLIGANVYNNKNTGQGTTTNAYGFYSLTLDEGEQTIRFSYLGYAEQEALIQMNDDVRLNIELKEGVTMKEIVVSAEEKDKNVESTEMGTLQLEVAKIKTLPVIFGEVDILKTLQLLPGVMSAGEGTSGFYVRGGGPDQNLILLDEAVVYNSGHMLGFFSVFNADAIKNTTLIKGGMPANYGGRLSSVVDVQMKDGNNKSFGAQGGIGLIASRLTLEGPIQKNKSSFILSARRTYALDLAQPALDKTQFAGTNYYFYDLNAKMNYQFSDKDRLFLSGYFGRDVFIYNSAERDITFRMPYGNATGTLRWNHLFSEKLFMNLSAIYNDYDFTLGGGQDQFSVEVFSGVRDYNAKLDFDYFFNNKHTLKFGANYTFHRLTPNIARATSGTEVFENDLDPKYGHESAIYISDDIKFNNRLTINAGLRASAFTQVGPFTSGVDGTVYKNLEPVKTYTGLEPRISGKYTLDPSSSIKAGVSLNNQYIHLVSNTSSTLPTDVWVPSSESVAPQKGIQYALGYFKNFKNDNFETSVEVYYKDLRNQIDYGETYVPDVTVEVEDEFVFGKGRAYGAEFFVKKNNGKLTGWVGYTLSKTEKIFPDIKNGEAYPAKYDRTHDLSVVANYALSDKWVFGGAFIYGTGNTYTPIQSLYFIEQNLNINFGPRNSARIDAYHRIDLSATYYPKPKKEKSFKSWWTFSVYNIYNRKNPFFIYYVSETDFVNFTATNKALKVSLFPVIPSVTWNFNFAKKEKNN